MKKQRTMAIRLNTRGFGYVVLSEKGEILDSGIATIRPANSEKCFKRVQEIISYYLPGNLIIEDIDKSDRIKKLIAKISKHGESHLKVYKYTREQIKNAFEVFGARNKFEISRKVVEAYPELKSKLPEKRKPWKPEDYYQGLFDAVALIITHYYLIK